MERARRTGTLACPDRRGACPQRIYEVLEQRFFRFGPFRDREVLQQLRRPQNPAETVAGGEREVNRVGCAVEEQSKEQLLFLAAVADLADAELPPLRVGEERVFDAALRERIVLHADGEEVLERAAAELHHVAEPDGARPVVGV